MDENEHDEKLAIANAMRKYGGRFVKDLSACILSADNVNLKKLKIAFPEIWEAYKKIARLNLVKGGRN